MANLNKVFLIGNLTRDPESRQLPRGGTVCNFGMAINRTVTLASGEQREDVCYVDLSAFGRSAEVIQQYCRKGSPLFVEGRLQYEQWDDRETGKKRSRLSVTVERQQLLGGSPAQQGGYPAQQPAGYQGTSAVPYQAPPYGQAAPGYGQVAPNYGGQAAPGYGQPAPSYGQAPPPAAGRPPVYNPPAGANMPAFKPLPEQSDTSAEIEAEDADNVVDDLPF